MMWIPYLTRQACAGLALLLVMVTPVLAQEHSAVTGTVRDAATGEVLPSANLRVLGSELGTTTNLEGQYRLVLPPGHHRLAVSFLGYQSDTVHVELGAAASRRDVALWQAVLQAGELTVIADEEDAATALMREVIAYKKDALEPLHSYRVDAYTKTVLRFVEGEDSFAGPDTVIGGILETQTTGFWKRPGHYKEMVKARRQTANYSASQNLFTVGRIPNFNDDVVAIGDKIAIGPTAPNALSYYDYELVDTVAFDQNVVYRLRIRPTTDLIPLFDGIISIAAATHQVVEVDVRGNAALDLSPIKDLRLRQQFALYREQFWLPILAQADFTLKLTVPPAPPVHTEQLSLMHGYVINEDVPQDVFDAYVTSVLPGADRPDAARWERETLLPLTEAEAAAYQRWDSLMAHAGILERGMLLLTRIPGEVRSLPVTGFSDFFRFNRVEGVHLGAGLILDDVLPATDVTLRGGYGFARDGWTYGADVVRYLDAAQRVSLGLEMHRAVSYREQVAARSLSPVGITWAALLNQDDPVDYYLRTGWSAYGRVRPAWPLSVEVRYLDEHHGSLTQQTQYSLFGASEAYRPNPPILDGHLRSGLVTLRYDTRQFRQAGLFDLPDRSRNSWQVALEIEHSGEDLLRSDFNFSRLALTLQRRQHLFGFSALDAHVRVGVAAGELPPQRLFDLVAYPSSPHLASGAFRLLEVKAFAGDQTATVQLDYNLGALPFRAAGLPLLRRFDLILYGGFGWTRLTDASAAVQTVPVFTTDGWYQEAGFGLGRILALFRLDFTWRLSHREERGFGISLKSTVF